MNTIPTAPAIKQQRQRQSVKHLPVGLFGSVMSTAGLALAWRLVGKEYGSGGEVATYIGIVAMAVFAILVLSYAAKYLKYPEQVRLEFEHPVLGSFFGTVGISVLLVSSLLRNYDARLQLAVWLVGVVITLLLASLMISRLLNGNVAPTSVAPSWLIAGVGSLDIVVTGGQFTSGWAHEINLLAAGVGSVSAVVFFVLIFSRLVHMESLAGALRPSKMIMVAPFGVGFIAYVNLSGTVDTFAALLFYFGLFLFVIVSYRLAIRPAPFSPSWWGIGFPMAALTNAALVYSEAVGGSGLKLMATILVCLLTVSVAVLAVLTLHALATGRLLKA